MPDNDKLSQALQRAYKIVESKGKVHILQTKELKRSDREILTRNRWLQEIVKGWYLLVRPDVGPGESSAWYANFWDFARIYLEHHYDDQYCLSAEYSIDLHVGKTTTPKQLIVMTGTAGGTHVTLPFDTSLLIYPNKDSIPDERETIWGLSVMPLPYALCKASPSYFLQKKEDAQVALLSIQDPSELIHTIIKYNFVRAAGRIVGAYSFLGQEEIAHAIKKGVSDAGIPVQVTNPFHDENPPQFGFRPRSSSAARIELMWSRYREKVIAKFPEPKGLPTNSENYLKSIEAIHTQDAYHSLSIEGYQVSLELIEKVENGEWNPEQYTQDDQYRNAMAARGYYEAFLEVKKSVEKILEGQQPGEVAKEDLPVWFRSLFSPLVEAKLLRREDLWGYRRHQVYIRNSRHTPLAREELLDAMETLYHCLINEEHAGVRAVLGHFIFVYIHPYMDGNGRTGRFLMNLMLASGGYPWAVVRVEKRNQYFQALESASVDNNIEPFAQFIASEMGNL